MSDEKREILAHDNLKYRAFDGTDWSWPSRPSLELLAAAGKGSFWNPGQGLLLQWMEQDDPDPVFSHWTSVDGLEVDLRLLDFHLDDICTLLRGNDYAGMGANDIDWDWIDDATVGTEALDMDLSDIEHALGNLDGWLYCAPDIVGGEPLDRALARVGLRLAPAPSVGDRVSSLDMADVAKIARNELELLVETAENEVGLCGLRTATDDLAKGILEGYLSLGSRIAAPVVGRALIAFEAEFPENGAPSLSDEFIAGHALAVTARNHAAHTFDDGYLTFFAERALELRPSALLDHIDGVDDSRMVGIDMSQRFLSAQSCTPQDVRDRAAEYELGDGKNAADVLEPADFEEIARGIMASFRDVELEYSDLEDIDCRIEEKMAEKSAQAGPSISIPCVERQERADDTDER